MNLGTLYIISAPSGSGKSTIIKEFIKINKLFNIYVSISYTTRKIRINEVNKKNYYFIKKKKFKEMILKNYFLEYEKIFNNYYGTSKKNINKYLKKGIDIFLEIDWKGAKNIRKKFLNTVSIFIIPPSKNELKKRLYKRGQDSKSSICNRINSLKETIKHYKEYDYLIVNDNLSDTLEKLKIIYLSEKFKINKKNKYFLPIIKNLLSK